MEEAINFILESIALNHLTPNYGQTIQKMHGSSQKTAIPLKVHIQSQGETLSVSSKTVSLSYMTARVNAYQAGNSANYCSILQSLTKNSQILSMVLDGIKIDFMNDPVSNYYPKRFPPDDHQIIAKEIYILLNKIIFFET